MFNKNIKLLAKKNFHENNHAYIRAMKSHDGNAMAYCLRAVPVDKINGYVVLDTTMAEINPITRHYLRKNVVFQNLAKKEMIAPKGFVGYCVLDVSALAESRSKDHRALASGLMHNTLLIGPDPQTGEKIVVVYVPDNKCKNAARAVKYAKYIIVSNLPGSSNRLCREDIYDGDSLKEGWIKFGSNRVASASKGRKKMQDLFADDADGKFDRIFSEATFGESDKSYDGTTATAKQIADKVTRLGSKATRMGSTDTYAYNYLIALTKDDNCDGAGLNSARLVAEHISKELGIRHSKQLEEDCEGYILQERPATIKGAAKVVSEKYMQAVANRHKIYRINVENMSDDDEKMLDRILDKRFSNEATELKKTVLQGYTAIGIISDDTRGWDIYGDTNFYKDSWDYRRKSGINVLNVAHFNGDFMSANTSGQMMKIVTRAIVDTQDIALKRIAHSIIKGIIDKAVDSLGVIDSERKIFKGDSEIDLSYEAGAYMLLNPNTYKDQPAIMQKILEQRIDSANTMLDIDKYPVPGHSGMITVGCDYWLTGKSMLNVIVKNGDVIVEVYDPVANEYYKKNGISHDVLGVGIKYPCMGTREFVKIRYISEEEYIRRIQKNTDIDDKTKELIINSIKRFKDGGVMIPANLELIAWIAAGSDEDGDKFTLLFPTKDGMDIPAIIINSGLKSRAVKIATPDDESIMVARMDKNIFSVYGGWGIFSGNKSVGLVTNTFRVFTEGLLQNLNNPEVLDFYQKLLSKLAMGKTGDKEYKSIVEESWKKIGVTTYDTCVDALERIIKAIQGVRLDVKNIRLILEDFDVLGRHCQELTIDAQKKFYEVFCDWMDMVNGFTVLPLKFGIKLVGAFEKGVYGIKFVRNNGYTYKDDCTEVEAKKGVITIKSRYEYGDDTLVLVDTFSYYRVYAANQMIKKLSVFADKLNADVAEYISKRTQGDGNEKMSSLGIDPKVAFRLRNMQKYIYTVGGIMSESLNALNTIMEVPMSYMPRKMAEKAKAEMRKSINAEYADILRYIDNEFRACYTKAGLGVADVIDYISTALYNSVGTKVLKQERFAVMAERSENPDFEYKLKHDVSEAVTDNNGNLLRNRVSVCSGNLMIAGFTDYGMDLEIDLLPGEYNLIKKEDGVYLARPFAEFISIPKVDEDVRTICQTVYDKETAKKLDKALISSKEYTIETNTKNHKYALLDANGDVVVTLNFGSTKNKVAGTNNVEATVLCNYYKDFTGKLVAKAINTTGTIGKNNKAYYNFIIALKK